MSKVMAEDYTDYPVSEEPCEASDQESGPVRIDCLGDAADAGVPLELAAQRQVRSAIRMLAEATRSLVVPARYSGNRPNGLVRIPESRKLRRAGRRMAQVLSELATSLPEVVFDE